MRCTAGRPHNDPVGGEAHALHVGGGTLAGLPRLATRLLTGLPHLQDTRSAKRSRAGAAAG